MVIDTVTGAALSCLATARCFSATSTVMVVAPVLALVVATVPTEVTTPGVVRDALVVPVTALLAQPAQRAGEAGGGYAVEVTGAGGHHLVPVSVGMIDNATGLVQVTSGRLAVGERVVVPAL